MLKACAHREGAEGSHDRWAALRTVMEQVLHIKDKGPKGVSSRTQGDQVRVSGKKRDDLQSVIAGLKEEDFGLPLQFENFRD